MPVFQWEGRNSKNELQKGEMDAPTEEAVRGRLNRLRITSAKVKKKPKDLFENVSFLQPKVKHPDIIVFARQFSTMIDAGLPIIQCLEILHSQQENKTFKKMIKAIKESVENGLTLAESLKRFPQNFDDLFVNMISAGEAGGILDTILRRVSSYMEKAAKLKSKVKGAMVYPIIVIVVAVLVVSVILIFVIPVFSQMFAEYGGALPLPTQIVVGLSEFVKSKALYILGALIIFGFAFVRFYKTKKGELIVDRVLLKLPVLGMLFRKVAVARFTRTMGTMLASGVAILDALDIVARTAGNKIIEKSDLQRSGGDFRGTDHGRPTFGKRGFSQHGVSDDRRWRVHRCD